MLRSRNVFLFAAVVLGLGIGVNAALFSLLYQVAIRSLPVKDPLALVVLDSGGQNYGWSTSDNRAAVFSYPMYEALRQNGQTLAEVIGRTSFPAAVAWGGDAERASVEVVTTDFFAVLGLTPTAGRFFEAGEDAGNPVVVLSHSYWVSRFTRDPDVLNRHISLNNHPVLIAGVAPEGFHGLLSGQSPALYAPVSLMPVVSPGWRRTWQADAYWLNLFARLKPGTSVGQAEALFRPLFRSTLDGHLQHMPDVTAEARERALAKPLRLRPAAQGLNVLRDQWRSPLLMLFAMAGVVLLIACANVAGLLSLRAAARRKEIALRFALGASRWQVSRGILTGSVMLGLAGGVAGFLLCAALTQGLLSLIPGNVTGGWVTSRVNLQLFAFSLALALLTGVLSGLIPALGAARHDLSQVLKQQSAGPLAAAQQSRSRQVFAALQICLSLTLLVGAGLFIRTVAALMSTSPGFASGQLVTFSLDASLSGYSRSRSSSLFERIEDELRALPLVKSVARAGLSPFGGSGWGNGVTAPGSRVASGKYVSCSQNAVSAGFFETLGVPIVAGREFTTRDTANSSRVAVLNETFARFLFEGDNPLGRRIRTGSNDSELEVVGVVKDFKHGSLREEPAKFLYVPYPQMDEEFAGQSAFFIRTRDREEKAIGVARAITAKAAPGVPIIGPASMKAMIASSTYKERLIAAVAIAFGVLAALLAAAGLYGVVAYTSATRSHEFGIRLALGAHQRRLLLAVLGEAANIVAIGAAGGMMLSWVLAGLLRSQIYGVPAHDPWTFAAAALLLAAVAFSAALGPALRAMRVDPVRTLRYE
jgi:predicted permease